MAQDKVVAKTEDSPCGCKRVFYADGTGELSPCMPCALIQAGQNMMNAGNLLIAAGNRFGHDLQQARLRSMPMPRFGNNGNGHHG